MQQIFVRIIPIRKKMLPKQPPNYSHTNSISNKIVHCAKMRRAYIFAQIIKNAEIRPANDKLQ